MPVRSLCGLESHDELRSLWDRERSRREVLLREWLAGRERRDEIAPLLAESREVFERLRAQPRLERLEAIEEARATSASPSA